MARRLVGFACSVTLAAYAEDLITAEEADANLAAAAASATTAKLSATAKADVARPPLFLVPGLTGSALEVRLHDAPMPRYVCETDSHGKWENAWLNPLEALPYVKDCLLARLTLMYDAVTDTYSNLKGIDLRATDFASKQITNRLYNYEYGAMLKHLGDNMGYELGEDMWLAPYDWRLAGDAHSTPTNGVGGYYLQLQQIIEAQVERLGKKAVVVSHSLGGPTMLYFFHNYVSNEWKEQNIAAWIALSGAFLGGATQANAYLGGYTFGMPSWLVPHDYVRPVQINASSGVWLSPDPMAFENMTIVETPSKKYAAADLPHLLDVMGAEQPLALFKKLKGQLAALQKAPSSMHTEHWYSRGIKTAESFRFDKEVSHGFNEAPSEVIYGDGDGIVNLVSLRVVERFWNEGTPTRLFPGASHFGMLSDPRVLNNLTDYLSEQGRRESAIVV